jgi:alpha-galactosidase
MRDALLATRRPIVFSMCNGWDPSVQPQTWAGPVSNLWRTTDDISDSFGSMVKIFHQNVGFASFAGPGRWNDPDMLEIGNGGMTDTEYRSHFSLWSEMAAPLLAGTDLRGMTAATRTIFTNREVIAVDQDRLGAQESPVATSNGLWVLTKPLANGDRAVVLFNETGFPATISTTARQAGLSAARDYVLRDLWRHTISQTAGTISATVAPHGTVMYRVGEARSYIVERNR